MELFCQFNLWLSSWADSQAFEDRAQVVEGKMNWDRHNQENTALLPEVYKTCLTKYQQ